ncbi:MAG: hypothetical protein SPL35_06715 [Bacteroidales bacterium]|nr:hypothetical protein [Bacteroidales bacterium]
MKLRYLALLALLTVSAAVAQEKRERTILTTDRSFYAAGESIKCSAFCLNAEGSYSNFSCVAYIEVYGKDGPVATGKISLTGGRGGGSLDLPSDVPTGNYRIAAYTSSNKNEQGYDFNTCSRVITIYNTSSTARAKDGVKIVSELSPAASAPHNSSVVRAGIGAEEDGFIPVSITADKDASLSVSVWKDEGFPNYDINNISTLEKLAWRQPTTRTSDVIEDYDGEVIYANIKGSVDSAAIFLASPGSRSDIYKGQILPDGRTAFFTDNIYGNKDVAIISLSGVPATFEASFESPFVGISADYVPALELAPSMKDGLNSLDAALRIRKSFDADTLYTALKARKLDLLGPWQNRYNLDDYTRFVTMREVFIEYLHDIHINRDKDGINMVVKTVDVKGVPSFRHFAQSLILLDGVPVTDHGIIYEMDPHLIKSVEIYPSNYSFGTSYFCGAANFVTYTGNLAGAQLGKNSRILSFKGVSVPMVYSASKAAYNPNFPSISETVFWHPLVSIPAGETFNADIVAPGLPGKYILTIEGFTSDGTPVFYQKEF